MRTGERIVRVEGSDHVERIVIENLATGQTRTEPAAAVFVFIGADAKTSWLPAALVRDARGYICTGRDVTDLLAQASGRWALERDPYLLETRIPGVFAAGDVRHGSTRGSLPGSARAAWRSAFVRQYLA